MSRSRHLSSGWINFMALVKCLAAEISGERMDCKGGKVLVLASRQVERWLTVERQGGVVPACPGNTV